MSNTHTQRKKERKGKGREGRGKKVCTHLYPVSGKYDVFGLKSTVLMSAEGSGKRGAAARRRLLRWIWTPGCPAVPSTH